MMTGIKKIINPQSVLIIAIDVNSPRKPNQFARDCYWAWVYQDRLDPNFSDIYGGKSLKNILSGNGKLEYSDYNKNSKK